MEPISQIAPALPGRRILNQKWVDLVFLHWRVDPAEVRHLLPAGIEPDIFDGSTWVGLIPFQMRDSAFFGGPAVPYFGTFVEVNVRLYGVDRFGRRGVVFASLEASRLAAVLAARFGFGLPYKWAAASFVRDVDTVTYASRRISAAAPTTRISVRASQEPLKDNALADFLTARWRLFVARGATTLVQANEHGPWALYPAELLELDDHLLAAAGFGALDNRAPDSVLYSPGVLTNFSGPQRV